MLRHLDCTPQLEDVIELERGVGDRKIDTLTSISVLKTVYLCLSKKALNANILTSTLGWCGRQTSGFVSQRQRPKRFAANEEDKLASLTTNYFSSRFSP